MKAIPLVIIAVLLNVGAQVLIKLAAKYGAGGSGLMSWLSPWLIMAVALYGGSFLLTVRVMAHNSISLAAPIMAGSAFVMTAVAGLVFFSEPINMVKAAGIFLVFSGVLLLGTAA